MRIDVAVADPGWGEALGQRLVWLVGQDGQAAELRLNPPHLGPLEITLSVANDQTNVAFFSSHAAVREAIDAALPALRAALAENGIQLGNATVSSDVFAGQREPHGKDGHGNGGGRAQTTPESRAPGLPAPRFVREGRIDTFA
jgi:flagellar hook-length control protein FliK